MTKPIEISLLARLIETGVAQSSVRNQQLISRFETARWIDRTTRKNEWKVREVAVEQLTSRLDELLPLWREDFAYLRSISRNPYDPKDIEAMPSFRRSAINVDMINRRNWNAAKGLGPKHTARIPANLTLTKDWVIRFRPNKGLHGRIGEDVIDFYKESQRLSECFIPERAWIKFGGFSNIFPRLIITCENLGAYIDLPTVNNVTVIYSPGADTEPAIKLLNALPDSHWMHFGDLDREGVEIAHQISNETGRPLELFIPRFALEYLTGAPDAKTQWGHVPDLPLFEDLKRNKKRIFQEVFMLDARLASELAHVGDKYMKP